MLGWLVLPYPQLYALPSESTASVWRYPALTWLKLMPSAVFILYGLLAGSLAVGVRPSWPLLLSPQLYTLPSDASAREALPPAVTWVIFTPFGSGTGFGYAFP